jgi:hypothetical protein
VLIRDYYPSLSPDDVRACTEFPSTAHHPNPGGPCPPYKD